MFWEWKGPHYLPATLAASLLSPQSGSRHVVHGGLLGLRTGHFYLSSSHHRKPDLGKDGRMEWVLESGPLAGVPEVTPKFTSQVQTANTQASSDEKLSWKLAQTKAMPHT